jgi:selenocysteine lyase/cysteine desulfurase
MLRPGDHVVTSVVEHNSVLRPLRELESQGVVEVTRVACDGKGIVDPGDLEQAVKANTRLIALVHASNVTGAIQPVHEAGAIARSHGVRLLVDAAQSAGHLPLDVQSMNADLLATPAHKGLMSPLGLGVLYIAPGVEQQLKAIRQGGTGTRSDEDIQPEALPDKYESGNVNSPAVIGLGAGVTHLAKLGIETIWDKKRRLTAKLLEGLATIDQVTLYGPCDATQQVGVVSLNIADYDPREVASMLDTSYAIQVRPGIHCAPRMHAALGTTSRGGTVRFSLGLFTTDEDIERAIRAVQEIAASTITA